MAETSFAAETTEKQVLYCTTGEERDRIFEAEMEKVMAELNQQSIAKGPQYHYKSENLEYQYKTAGGFAGNQVRDGYRFPTGGGFFYSEDGGPQITLNINFEIPRLPETSVSVGLGMKKDTLGQFVSVPNTTDYFKLYVEKEVEIRPYVVYRKRSGMDGEWEVDHTGAVPIVVSVALSAEKV